MDAHAAARDAAKQAHGDGRYEVAVQLFSALLVQQPHDHALLCNRSASLLKLGRAAEAAADARRALNCSPPGQVKAHYRLACALKSDGRAAEAWEVANSGLAINPHPQLVSLCNFLVRREPLEDEHAEPRKSGMRVTCQRQRHPNGDATTAAPSQCSWTPPGAISAASPSTLGVRTTPEKQFGFFAALRTLWLRPSRPVRTMWLRPSRPVLALLHWLWPGWQRIRGPFLVRSETTAKLTAAAGAGRGRTAASTAGSSMPPAQAEAARAQPNAEGWQGGAILTALPTDVSDRCLQLLPLSCLVQARSVSAGWACLLRTHLASRDRFESGTFSFTTGRLHLMTQSDLSHGTITLHGDTQRSVTGSVQESEDARKWRGGWGACMGLCARVKVWVLRRGREGVRMGVGMCVGAVCVWVDRGGWIGVGVGVGVRNRLSLHSCRRGLIHPSMSVATGSPAGAWC